MKKKGCVRPGLLELVPKDAKRILDVGCEKGIFGRQIIERGKDIEIIGIERDEKYYREAVKNLSKVILADIEKIELPFEKNYFDCIIAGDVLEHLVDPWSILGKLKAHLRNGGVMISSVPNVRYYKILTALLRGHWDYADSGIMDRTHLRFFTLASIKENFQAAQLRIEEIRRNIVCPRVLRIANTLLFNKLREFMAYQYYIVARKPRSK